MKEFEDIDTCLNTNPKVWDDYPLKKQRDRSFAVTPLRGLQADCEYVYVPTRLFNELEELEKSALAYGWDVLKLVEKVPLILNQHPNLFLEPGLFTESDQYNKPSIYKMDNRKSTRTFRYANVYDFLDEDKIVGQLKDGVELVFSDRRSPEHVCVTLIPELLAVSPEEFAKTVNKELLVNEKGFSLLNRQADLKKKLDKKVCLLRKRARDPFPFWRTFGAALQDIVNVS